MACQLNCIDIVNIFLDLKRNSDDVNQKNSLNNKTGLHFACENNSIDLVRLLLSNEKIQTEDEDSSGNTPMSYAKFNGNKDIIELLINKI